MNRSQTTDPQINITDGLENPEATLPVNYRYYFLDD
jgi:hypothetical protein